MKSALLLSLVAGVTLFTTTQADGQNEICTIGLTRCNPGKSDTVGSHCGVALLLPGLSLHQRRCAAVATLGSDLPLTCCYRYSTVARSVVNGFGRTSLAPRDQAAAVTMRMVKGIIPVRMKRKLPQIDSV